MRLIESFSMNVSDHSHGTQVCEVHLSVRKNRLRWGETSLRRSTSAAAQPFWSQSSCNDFGRQCVASVKGFLALGRVAGISR